MVEKVDSDISQKYLLCKPGNQIKVGQSHQALIPKLENQTS